MIEEKAKFVIGEIKNIPRYDRIIESINNDLNNLKAQLEALGGPSCPQGHIKLAPVSSIGDKTGIVLELITQEQELEKEKQRFIQRRKEAVIYKSIFFQRCPVEEVFFCTDFLRGTSYETLRYRHNTTNPYTKMLRIVKSVM